MRTLYIIATMDWSVLLFLCSAKPRVVAFSCLQRYGNDEGQTVNRSMPERRWTTTRTFESKGHLISAEVQSCCCDCGQHACRLAFVTTARCPPRTNSLFPWGATGSKGRSLRRFRERTMAGVCKRNVKSSHTKHPRKQASVLVCWWPYRFSSACGHAPRCALPQRHTSYVFYAVSMSMPPLVSFPRNLFKTYI